MKKQRVYSLDLLRLIFAYIVAMFHVGVDITPGSLVCVEIFFIISGFFLARKYYTNEDANYNQWNYTLDHAKSLYPHYLFALIMYFLYVTTRSVVHYIAAPSGEQIQSMLYTLYNQIPDILFLQSADHCHESLNYPAWQLSAMLIAGYFVYGLLFHNEKLSRMLLFPAFILMSRSIIRTGVSSAENYGPIYMALLYAFSNLCIGVLAYYFTTTKYYAQIKSHRVLFNIATVLSLVCIFGFGEFDEMHLIISPLIIYGCIEPDSWINVAFNRKCFRHCARFSYAVYVNHAMMQRFVYARIIPRLDRMGITLTINEQGIIFFVAVTLYSLATVYIVNLLLKYLARAKK